MGKLIVPQPEKSETERRFIARCMSNIGMRKVMKINNQRAAVCYKSWDNHNNIEEK